jgi:hypothetical protein
MKLASLLGALAIVVAVAPHSHAQGIKGMSGGLSVDVPVGNLDSLVTMGFGLSVRTPFGDQAATWSGRGSFGFNYFAGKPNSSYANLQFLIVGADLVHRSSENFYQFFGAMMPSTKYAIRSASTSVQRLYQSTDFGLTGGIGFNFVVKETKLFAEVAGTTIFTGQTNSSWFPVRIGMRF